MLRVSLAIVVLACATRASARIWVDSTGKYHQKADLVEFDGQTVVLKKAEGQLVSVPLEQLSHRDQEYLKTKEAKNDIAGAAAKDRTWSLADGKKFAGKLTKFGRKDVVISRKLAVLYVNGKPFDGLPGLKKYIVPLLVGHEEGREIKNADSIQDLIGARKGADLVYRVEGAVFEIESGEDVAVPIWLLSDKDRKAIEPQWDAWLAANKDNHIQDLRQAEQSTLARAIFNEHQRNGAIDHRVQSFQREMQWSQNTPGTWRIRLQRPDNSITTIDVSANDEMSARTSAQQQYPHSTIIQWNRL
jgi:hypothetical protein